MRKSKIVMPVAISTLCLAVGTAARVQAEMSA